MISPVILSDRNLKARLASGSIVIEPLEAPDVQIQPASIDLRLGAQFRIEIDNTPEGVVFDVRPGSSFRLLPGQFALASTVEWIRVPADLVARVEGRSSIGRRGVIVHATAGYVDPGFEGEITLELANLAGQPIDLLPGMRICQIVFHELSSPAERPYGPSRGSKYNGQRGPTLSRLDVTK